MTAPRRRPVIIDCDPGVDDAVALMLACASPEIDLLGVTTVAGNVGVDLTTRNALRVLTLAGRTDIPVAAGAARPLVRRPPARTRSRHGIDGLAGATLPEPAVGPMIGPALGLLAGLVSSSPRPVTLVAVGPLTNVAVFMAVHPELATRLERLIVLGGCRDTGGVPAVEFNVGTDPEAAYRVLTDPGIARLPTTVIGIDVSAAVRVDAAGLDRLGAGGQLGQSAAALLRGSGEPPVTVHDAVAVAEAIWPRSVQVAPAVVTVDCGDTATRGRLRTSPVATSHTRVAVSAQTGLLDLIVHRLTDAG